MKHVRLFLAAFILTAATVAAQVAPATSYATHFTTKPNSLVYQNGSAKGDASKAPSITVSGFEAKAQNGKALFQWQVTANEAGERFEIERSLDGKRFTTAALIFTSEKEGSELYLFKEALSKKAGVQYRLKIVGKDGSVAYSELITVKQ